MDRFTIYKQREWVPTAECGQGLVLVLAVLTERSDAAGWPFTRAKGLLYASGAPLPQLAEQRRGGKVLRE